MPDYKQLFYKSQAEIADMIDELSLLENRLKDFMSDCEDKILDNNSGKQEKIIKLSPDHLTNPKK